MADKQRQLIRTNQVLQSLLATLKWHVVTGSLLCQIALWDMLGTNLVAIIFFYEHYWRVIMRLLLFLFFIMLKLHKPVILSEKQINKFQSEPKVM